ncbi:hypothetical protein LB464_12700 [Escherichia coli]|nr:hypothetical protein [Escherichia coli]MCY0203262.1 hypothetical protein [Escherichia coli]
MAYRDSELLSNLLPWCRRDESSRLEALAPVQQAQQLHIAAADIGRAPCGDEESAII